MRRSTVLLLVLVPVFATGRATADDDPAKAPAKAPAAESKKDASPAPAAGAAAAKPEPRTEEQLDALRKQVLSGLTDPKPQVRAAAAENIVFTWPDSAPILDAALKADDAGVRFEATVLLRREELGDMRDRIRPRLADADARVRLHAVRAARHLDWPEIEPDFIRIVSGDPSFLVIQEALFGLEKVGTIACAQVVFRGWTTDTVEDHHRRYKRVLVKVVGADFGEEVDKWRTAIEKLETAARAQKPTNGGKPSDAKGASGAPPADKPSGR